MNGRADSVLIDAKVYEKQLKAVNLARLLAEAESQVATAQTRPARAFLDEFKNAARGVKPRGFLKATR